MRPFANRQGELRILFATPTAGAVVWVATVLLASVFGISGIIKLIGFDSGFDLLATPALSTVARRGVGILELLGAGALWLPRRTREAYLESSWPPVVNDSSSLAAAALLAGALCLVLFDLATDNPGGALRGLIVAALTLFVVIGRFWRPATKPGQTPLR